MKLKILLKLIFKLVSQFPEHFNFTNFYRSLKDEK